MGLNRMNLSITLLLIAATVLVSWLSLTTRDCSSG